MRPDLPKGPSALSAADRAAVFSMSKGLCFSDAHRVGNHLFPLSQRWPYLSMYIIYYTLKPFIPRRLQLWMRRIWVRRKLRRSRSIWPIDERAAISCESRQAWPDGKRFALVLMHDVDTAKGQEMCLELAKIDEEMGFRSSFNFVPERYHVSAEIRRILVRKGFEVAVHGLKHDGKLFLSRKRFQEQAPRINHYLKAWGSVGFVSPSMHRNLDWVHDLQIEYDASTFDTDPFEPQPDGARTILPFFVPPNFSNSSNPFNTSNPINSSNPSNSSNPGNHGTSAGFVELPYTLPQDFTLFVLMKEKDNTIWKRKLDWIVRQGGMALLITHPDYMRFNGKKRAFYEYPAEYYKDFLCYIKKTYEGQYWNPLPQEMARFWREKAAKQKSRGPSRRYAVVSIDPLTDTRWDTFVENHPYGWICHLSGWKRVLENTFPHMKAHYLALEDSKGEIKAALPLYEVRSRITGNRLVSIPFATLSDPLVSDSDQLDRLLGVAETILRDMKGGYLEIRTTWAYRYMRSPHFVKNNGFKCHSLRLDVDLLKLWKSLPQKGIRYEVNRGKKNLVFRLGESEDDLRHFYLLYSQTRRRLGLPTHPYLFLKNLWEIFRPDKRIELCLATSDGRVMASHILFKFNGRVSAEFEGWDRRFHRLSPNHFLFWEEIRQAHEQGFKVYDFGRTSTQNIGLMEFKSRWRTEVSDLYIFYYGLDDGTAPPHREDTISYRLMRRLCRLTPESLHPLLGKWIYSHLG